MTAKSASSSKCECGGPKGDCHLGITQDECSHERVVMRTEGGVGHAFCHGCGRDWVPGEHPEPGKKHKGGARLGGRKTGAW